MDETHRPQEQRAIPVALRRTWERATQDPDPLAALDVSNTLWPQWARLQAALAAEALAAGATWEDIGHTLGISRQAAWARFRTAPTETLEGEGSMHEQIAQARVEVQERLKNVHARIHARDDAWHADRANLQGQLRALDKEHADDRAALLDDARQLKQKLKALRDQTHSPRVDAPSETGAPAGAEESTS